MSEENKRQDNSNNEVRKDNKPNQPKKTGLIKSIIAAVLVGVICTTGGFMYGKEKGRLLPATYKNYSSSKVFATIGDTKITGTDVQKQMDPIFYLQGNSKMTDEEVKSYEANLVDYLTTLEVLYQEGKKNNLKADDSTIQTNYESFMSNVKSQYSMTEDEYFKKFSTSKDEIKKELEKEAIATSYLGKKIEVTDDEAKKYYEDNKDDYSEIRASHILIKNTDDEGNDVSKEQKAKNKKKIEEILAKVKAGEDFAELAKKYSEDTTAEDGGDLGFFAKGKMVAAFEDAAFALKNGETSDVVESDYGYHIIKRTDDKEEAFNDVKDKIESTIAADKQTTLIDKLLKEYGVDKSEENK